MRREIGPHKTSVIGGIKGKKIGRRERRSCPLPELIIPKKATKNNFGKEE
jgi:hypothetical protein